MRTALVYISALAVLASAFVSCRREGKVIPRGEMAEIYAEMFVLDQEIAGDPDIRREADTLFVYEPVFRKYGYTADDYRSSMAYYIQDPDRYVRILKRTVDILDGRRKELKSEKARLESISHGVFPPGKDIFPVRTCQQGPADRRQSGILYRLYRRVFRFRCAERIRYIIFRSPYMYPE